MVIIFFHLSSSFMLLCLELSTQNLWRIFANVHRGADFTPPRKVCFTICKQLKSFILCRGFCRCDSCGNLCFFLQYNEMIFVKNYFYFQIYQKNRLCD